MGREDVALAPVSWHLGKVLVAYALGLEALLDVGALGLDAGVALVGAGDETLDLFGGGAGAGFLGRGAFGGFVEGEEVGGCVVSGAAGCGLISQGFNCQPRWP